MEKNEIKTALTTWAQLFHVYISEELFLSWNNEGVGVGTSPLHPYKYHISMVYDVSRKMHLKG